MRLTQSKSNALRVLAAVASFTGVVLLEPTAEAFVNPSSPVFISEFHYDNTGADTNECIEVLAPAGTNLGGYSLVLYNGNGGAPYLTVSLSGVVVNDGSGTGTLAFDIAGIQNGETNAVPPPDAMALIDNLGNVIEFWCYEGAGTATFVAVGGGANGLTCTNTVVDEDQPVPAPGTTLKRAAPLTWSGPSAGDCTGVSGPVFYTPRSIPAIQGASAAQTPFPGQTVQTTGVVSTIFPGLGGFYLQRVNSVSDGAAIAGASDGILVLSNAPVVVGERRTIQGTAVEQDAQTAIMADTVSLVSAGPFAVPVTPLPLPGHDDLTPPDPLYRERFEGMLVELEDESGSGTMRIAQTFFLGRYGQMTLASRDKFGVLSKVITPTQLSADTGPGSAARLLFAEQDARLLVLDDGQDINPGGDSPEITPYIGCIEDRTPDTLEPGIPVTSGAARVIRAGDELSDLVGILDQGLISSTGDTGYRLQPWDTTPVGPNAVQSQIDAITTSHNAVNLRPATPPNASASYEVVGYNVLNFFTTLNSRGAFDAAELVRQSEKLTLALCELNADVVGLIELENNPAAIDRLVTDLNARCGGGNNKWSSANANVNVIGTDQIKVGFVYNRNTTRVAPGTTPAVMPTPTPPGLNLPQLLDFNRPSLAVTFEQLASGADFTVVNNHWKSKGSACDLYDINGPSDNPPQVFDTNNGNLEESCRFTRLNMAQAMVEWLGTNPTGTTDQDYLLLGDMNSYAAEGPIQHMLTNGNLNFVDLVARDVGNTSQDFIFDGRSGNLSYGLATASMAAQVTNSEDWPINSDEPKTLDYEDHFNNVGCYEADKFRSADHDPISFALNLAGSTAAAPVPLMGMRGLGLFSLGLALAGLTMLRRRRNGEPHSAAARHG